MADPAGESPEAARVRQWATAHWGPDAPLTRLNVAYASYRCPDCGGPLVPRGTLRRCRRCRLDWYAQHHEPDGSAREGSYIDAFRVGRE